MTRNVSLGRNYNILVINGLQEGERQLTRNLVFTVYRRPNQGELFSPTPDPKVTFQAADVRFLI
jgi:hypothetical protein